MKEAAHRSRPASLASSVLPSEEAWHELANVLTSLAAPQVPAVLRAWFPALDVWPANLRIARSLEPGTAAGAWWSLGREEGVRGGAAALVRCLSAGTPEVLRLPARCGWLRSLHPECDWRVLNVEKPGELAQALSALSGLQGLDLSVAHPTGRARRAVLQCVRSGALLRMRRLDLRWLDFGPDPRPFQRSAGASRPNAWFLHLGDNGLSNALSAAVRQLGAPGVVRVLGVGGNDARAEDLQPLAVDGFLAHLTSLSLGPDPLAGRDVLALLRAGKPECLESLQLTGISGVDEVLGDLLDAELLPALRSVSVDACGITEYGLSLLARSPGLYRLSHLDLSGNDFRDEDVEKLLAIRRPPELSVLVEDGGLSEEVRGRLRQWLGVPHAAGPTLAV